ncbi:MAG: cysteine hydrolase [Lachnospiraceae bacterium]|nr:cysteine hydrolase [Lachnospiraceae bacterium]
MAKHVLAVIDMQNDFIDGALGTKEAEAIVEKVAAQIRDFDGEVVYTRDTHFEEYLGTQEGRKLPVPHCIKDTEGWQIRPQVSRAYAGDARVFDKLTFGSVELAAYLKDMPELESVTLIGLCTDICVISNALVIKAFLPEVTVRVNADCCAGVTPESHRNALEAMKMCQVEVVGEI